MALVFTLRPLLVMLLVACLLLGLAWEFLVYVMLSKLKTYAIAILTACVGLLAAAAAWYRGSLKSAQLKGSEAARRTEQKDAKVTQEGLQNEVKVLNSDNIDPDRFS